MSLPDPGATGRVWAPSVSSQLTVVRANPSTGWAWLAAVLPGLPFVAALLLVMSSGAAVPASTFALLLVLAEALAVGCCFADARELRCRGTEDAAPATWGLLPLVYLWRRATPFRDQFAALRPFWFCLIATPVLAGSFLFWANFVVRTSGA